MLCSCEKMIYTSYKIKNQFQKKEKKWRGGDKMLTSMILYLTFEKF